MIKKLVEKVKKMLSGEEQVKNCGSCSYHRITAIKDNRGYATGRMCTCKESKMYKEFIDSTYSCQCYKEPKRKAH